MGGLSIWHWLIVLIVLLLLITPILLITDTPLRRAVYRRRERSVYTSALPIGLYSPPAFMFLQPFFIITLLAIALGFLHTTHPTAFTSVVIGALFFPGRIRLVFLAAALIVHYRPNHSRALKYSIVLFPLVVPDVLMLSSLDWISFIVLFAEIAALFAVSICGAHRVRRLARNPTTPPPTRATIAIFSFIAWPPMWCLFFIMNIPLISPLFFFCRYILIERLSLNPILYLRSFGYDNAANVFSQTIAPAASQFGSLSALVHTSQKASKLTSKASILNFGRLVTVPDHLWQKWVTFWLERASLVIIDTTVRTESVNWEILMAKRAQPQRRIIFLAAEKQHDLSVINYGVTKKDLRRSSHTLADEVARVMLEGKTTLLKWRRRIWIPLIILGVIVFLLEVIGRVADVKT